MNKKPEQYNFAVNWEKEVLPLIGTNEAVTNAFADALQYYGDMLDTVYAFELDAGDKFIEKEVERKWRKARRCFTQLKWLREHLGAASLQSLTLSIAEALYPRKNWEVLEFGTDDAVVVDADRSIVFDFDHFDQLSASASLVIVNAQNFHCSEDAAQEALAYLQQRVARTKTVLAKLKRALKEDDVTVH